MEFLNQLNFPTSFQITFLSDGQIGNVSAVAILSEHGSQHCSSVCSRAPPYASQIARSVSDSYFWNSGALFGAVYHRLGK